MSTAINVGVAHQKVFLGILSDESPSRKLAFLRWHSCHFSKGSMGNFSMVTWQFGLAVMTLFPILFKIYVDKQGESGQRNGSFWFENSWARAGCVQHVDWFFFFQLFQFSPFFPCLSLHILDDSWRKQHLNWVWWILDFDCEVVMNIMKPLWFLFCNGSRTLAPHSHLQQKDKWWWCHCSSCFWRWGEGEKERDGHL